MGPCVSGRLGTRVRREFGRFSELTYEISPQSNPARLVVELDGPVTDETKRFVAALNVATAAANALVPEAYEICRREHERLARELGLERPRPGFSPS
jgi:hypothetical protein